MNEKAFALGSITKNVPVLILLALAVGCDNGGHERTGKEAIDKAGATRLGAVLPTFGHPFFIALKEGLEAGAKEGNVSIDVRDGQDDDRKQAEQVQTLLTLGVDAIILCPRDQNALTRVVKDANQENVPVIALNRRVNGGKVITYVGANDTDAGRAQAQALIKALGTKGGKILYLQGTQGSSPQVERAKGFRDVLADHAEITIADERFCDFQADQAKSVMTTLTQRFSKGEIDAIVAQSDEMAIPAADVAHSEGWDHVIVIGCDGTKAAFDAIKDGRMTASVLQDAREQGRIAVEQAIKALRGETVPEETITPLPVIDTTNVDQHQPSY